MLATLRPVSLCPALLWFGLAACAAPSLLVPSPVLPPGVPAPLLPLGLGTADGELAVLQRLAQASSLSPLPPALLGDGGAGAGPLLDCRLLRLHGPERVERSLRLRLRGQLAAGRPDGFSVVAEVVAGGVAGELAALPLWYSQRGELLATVTLASPGPEQPAEREEFVVGRWLPSERALLLEWQRAVGPQPETRWAALPPTQLGRELPYASYLRATAYLLCREPPPPSLKLPLKPPR